jgi:hypothetical protein
MQLERPGSALQPSQPAALNAICGRRALLAIAQVVQKGDPSLETAGNLANVGLYSQNQPSNTRFSSLSSIHKVDSMIAVVASNNRESHINTTDDA